MPRVRPRFARFAEGCSYFAHPLYLLDLFVTLLSLILEALAQTNLSICEQMDNHRWEIKKLSVALLHFYIIRKVFAFCILECNFE